MNKIKLTFMICTIIAASLIMTSQPVFAEATIRISAGSSAVGCDSTNECYIPYNIKVGVGDKVTWNNDDTAAHTVTSGTPTGGFDGLFDSGLFLSGARFSYIFDKEGTIDYFCIVHPWMKGIIQVGATESEISNDMTKPKGNELTNDKTMITLKHYIIGGKIVSILPDNEINSLVITLDAPEQGSLTITLPRDVIDAKFNGEDDEFFVLVDGEEAEIIETKTEIDRTLTISFPADSEVIEVIGTFVIPEFGLIATMILTIAVISIVVLSTKSRLTVFPKI